MVLNLLSSNVFYKKIVYSGSQHDIYGLSKDDKSVRSLKKFVTFSSFFCLKVFIWVELNLIFQEGHAYMKKRANRNTNNAPLNHVKDSLPVFFQVHETLSGSFDFFFWLYSFNFWNLVDIDFDFIFDKSIVGFHLKVFDKH